MKYLFHFLLITSFVLIGNIPHAQAVAGEPEHEQYLPDYGLHRKKAAEKFLSYCNALLWTQYAPFKWKQKRYNWDPNQELDLALSELSKIEKWHTDALKPILSRLIDSTQDAHVRLLFEDKRLAIIPIEVDLVDNQVIVRYSRHPFIHVGDEIVLMNGEPPLDHLKKICYGTSNVKVARPHFFLDQAFIRFGACMPMPNKGDRLKLQVKQDGKLKDYTLDWYISTTYALQSSSNSTYLKQFVFSDENNSPENTGSAFYLKSRSTRCDLPLSFLKLTPEQSAFLAQSYGQTYGFETDVSYSAPKLDWSLSKQVDVNVGYIKIEDFSDIDFAQIDKTLPNLEKQSDCLVIDIRGNPGGYGQACYGLISRLTSTPLVNLMVSQILDESIIENYRHSLSDLDNILRQAKTDKDLQTVLGYKEQRGMPITLDFIRGIRREALTCIEEWNNGYTCTRFEPLFGLDKVQPHPTVRYTKPIFILMDERCASCADIFPALLKDNNRATLLGRKTTGAGGGVESFHIINPFGVQNISLTISFLLRNNKMVIEDVGVSPDFEHKKTITCVVNPAEEKQKAIEFAASQIKQSKKQ